MQSSADEPSPSAPPIPADALVEVSWEVCHRVGGIYQVLRSKAEAMDSRWDDQYLLVGPQIRGFAEVEIEAQPLNGWLEGAVDELAARGRGAVSGRWLVAGRPQVILVDPVIAPERLEVLRHRLHRDHGIPPARGNDLVDSVIGFGDAVFDLLEVLAARADEPRMLVQFHEWLGSLALPLLRASELPYASVFTTHATSVGRYVASSGEDLYERLSILDADKESERFGIDCQHAIERVCAESCDVFTTVSPITSEECTAMLGRTPDFITPNGLDMARFDLGHDFLTHHSQHKEEIHRFVMGHFFPSYSFDLDRTLYVFNAGRFEPRNKGFDLCLEAMSRLNAELRAEGSDLTIVFFIVTARHARSLDPRVLHARGLLDDLDEVAQQIGKQVAERLFRMSAAGDRPALDSLVDEHWTLRHRRIQHAFTSEEVPLLCTHVLDDSASDPVLGHLKHLGLTNTAEDRVKVVYHPDFIGPTNPLWGIDYEDFVRGCHLGLFPSCYEPWGYTPLECLAMGVPAITSDLSGFGRYAQEVFPDHEDWGLQVLSRRERRYHDIASDLTERVLSFCGLDQQAHIALRNQAVQHSNAFDWLLLAAQYHEAHDRALEIRFAPSRRSEPV